ncbi:MAG: hypothetical protein M3462_15905 [Chloroflexota bacterium]|nr:hypothetical protein [Chloroflexota bacterium]
MAQEWVMFHDDAGIAARALRGVTLVAPTTLLVLPVSTHATSFRERLPRPVRESLARLAAWLDQPVPRTARNQPIIRGGRWVGDPAEPASPAPRNISDRRP